MGDRSLRRRTGYWFLRKLQPRHTWQSSVVLAGMPSSVVLLASSPELLRVLFAARNVLFTPVTNCLMI